MNRSNLVCRMIVCSILMHSVMRAEPLPNTAPAATTITDVLATVDTLWNKDSYGECRWYVGRLWAADENIRIVLSTDELQTLLTHICRLPLQPNLEDSSGRVGTKWGMLQDLAWSQALKTSAQTWFEVAAVLGDFRSQLIPGYTGPTKRRLTFDETKEEKKAIREENRKQELESWYQGSLRMYFDYENSNLNPTLEAIRVCAQSLPPDERKPFIDRIKKLARSGAEEAKLLDTPRLPTRVTYPPVDIQRYHLSHMLPEHRQRELEKVRRDSDYTEEQLKELEAPYDGPLPVPATLKRVEHKYPSVQLMRKVLAGFSPEHRKALLDDAKKDAAYTEEELKILEAPFE